MIHTCRTPAAATTIKAHEAMPLEVTDGDTHRRRMNLTIHLFQAINMVKASIADMTTHTRQTQVKGSRKSVSYRRCTGVLWALEEEEAMETTHHGRMPMGGSSRTTPARKCQPARCLTLLMEVMMMDMARQ